MTSEILRIARRFRGPPESGNGGYVCGRLAGFIDGPAVIRLRVPPPLDTDLEVRREGEGVTLYDGETMVAEAGAATVDLEPPAPPSFEDAEKASRRYRGFESHTFPTCFVCGPERDPGDGLRIFAGPVDGSERAVDEIRDEGGRHRDGTPDDVGLVAAPWMPDESVDDGTGRVAPEFLWAALDCPGASSFEAPEEVARVLGELAVEIRGEVSIGERCVVLGWEIERDGRKHHTGTAVFGEAGDCRAVGRGIWFEVT